jgi:hypothetical protein
MTKIDRTKIEELMADIQCPKDFKCAKNGFDHLCKAKDIGLESHLECHEKSSVICAFAMTFGNSYFCRCPLRVYLSKELKK